MPSYFAYGSNMNVDQMADRCPGATVIGVGVLRDHRFVINRRGVATVVRSAGDEVHGVLWRVGAEHRETLDRLEGHHEDGRYDRLTMVVEVRGETVECELYVDPDSAGGPPRDGYLDLVVTGADHHDLPDWYVGYLVSWR